jgi:pSer/pThr/pTyr-binding forkhead associated (FHA) protein
VWNWDTTTFLAGQNSVTATLQVRAFNTTGKASNAAQPLELTLQAPVRPSNNDWVLPAIGVVAFLTLLLTLFMFFSRGRGMTAAGTVHKPATVTKGEPLAQLIVTEGPGLARQQEHFLYGDRSVSLGRDEDQSIRLPGERISRTHGEVVYRRNQFYYTDIKATNGTSVDGVPVPKGSLVPLKDGSELVFGGQTRAIFRLRPAGMAASMGQYQPLPTEARPPTVASALPPVPQTELRTTEWVRETPLGAHDAGHGNGGKDGKQS